MSHVKRYQMAKICIIVSFSMRGVVNYPDSFQESSRAWTFHPEQNTKCQAQRRTNVWCETAKSVCNMFVYYGT